MESRVAGNNPLAIPLQTDTAFGDDFLYIFKQNVKKALPSATVLSFDDYPQALLALQQGKVQAVTSVCCRAASHSRVRAAVSITSL